jgi:putative ABC transport system permease protein
MKAGDLARMSLGNLGRRKGRTVLTLVGVLIGIAALVLLVSLGIGLKVEILKVFQNEDELRTLRVSRATEAGKGGKGPFAMFELPFDAIPITDDDVAELRKLPGAETVVPDLNLLVDCKIGEEPLGPLPLAGAIEADEAYLRRHLRSGRLWTSAEERAVVVPSRLLEIRSSLKPQEVLGKTILFSRGKKNDPVELRSFVIAGILDSETMGLRGRQIYAPWARAVELRDVTKGGLFPFGYEKGHYLSVDVRAADARAVDDLKRQLKNLNYQVITAADILGAIDTVFLVIEGFMACVGAIGVIVALFGIANTMAMSVLERTREIGIMKALGARNRDIGRVFLVEAAVIGLVGGLAGLGLGSLAAVLLGWIARTAFELPPAVTLFHVSPWLALGSVGFSVLVSVAAGLVPALRAGRLDPVRALRYE